MANKRPVKPDPYSDIAMALLYIVIGVTCHAISKTSFTRTLMIMICIVAAYMIVRAAAALIKKGKK